jgi:hypothetical protein
LNAKTLAPLVFEHRHLTAMTFPKQFQLNAKTLAPLVLPQIAYVN